MMNARSFALRLLSRRDYATSEIRAKLIDREFTSAEIDAAIRSLSEAGLLDDRRVAAAHVRSASQVKNRGRLRIRRELEARGIERGVISQVLADLPEADEAAGIETFLQRKRLPQTLDPAARRRVFGQLMRRGFSADAIAKALRKHGKDDSEE
jgi:regulatory protein